jgi:hypothetical protein
VKLIDALNTDTTALQIRMAVADSTAAREIRCRERPEQYVTIFAMRAEAMSDTCDGCLYIAWMISFQGMPCQADLAAIVPEGLLACGKADVSAGNAVAAQSVAASEPVSGER